MLTKLLFENVKFIKEIIYLKCQNFKKITKNLGKKYKKNGGKPNLKMSKFRKITKKGKICWKPN